VDKDAFAARHAEQRVPAAQYCADGKTQRGSRTTDTLTGQNHGMAGWRGLVTFYDVATNLSSSNLRIFR
jgi:hypothetical protein